MGAMTFELSNGKQYDPYISAPDPNILKGKIFDVPKRTGCSSPRSYGTQWRVDRKRKIRLWLDLTNNCRRLTRKITKAPSNQQLDDENSPRISGATPSQHAW